MHQFISYLEAYRLITKHAAPRLLSTEELSVPLAIDRTIAEPVYAKTSIPSFTNSGRDGFVLSENGLEIAARGQAIDVVGELKAGDSIDRANSISGDATRIMTGAPVPDWGQAIVMIENATVVDNKILVQGQTANKDWIRQVGKDIHSGDLIADVGRILVPEHVQALISAGVTEVVVYESPKVAICSTGDELVDMTSMDLGSGKIYDSNKPFMESFIRSLNYDLVLSEHIGDTLESMVAFLKKAMVSGAHLVMSSGAVSMGSYDFVKPALQMIGAEIIFHKVTQKPGRPLLFAILPNGSLYFGLPGNPVSTVVNCRFYVTHALSAMQKHQPETPMMFRLLNYVEKPKGTALFLKAQCVREEQGVTVKTLEGQESFETSPLLTMNGWVVLGENLGSMKEGSSVPFYPANIRGLPDIF